jgi:hypothetical protein
LLLLHLRLQRFRIRLGRVQRRLGLFQLLLADRAHFVELARTLHLLPCEVDVGFLGGQLGLLARDRRLLAARVDLKQRRAIADPIARFHEDLRDLPVGLRLDGGRTQRLQRRHVLGRVLQRCRLGSLDADRCWRHRRGAAGGS